MDITPPPSPKGDESAIEKRRSGRNTNKTKKYVDDVDLNLSDDENLLSQLPPDVAAEMKASTAASTAINSEAASAENSLLVPETPLASGDVSQMSAGPNYAFIVSNEQPIQAARSN
jgi:hypothetical protein